MTVAELLQGISSPAAEEGALRVAGLCLDSRRVVPGDAFLACPGASRDGASFIADAAARGAVLVLADSRCGPSPSVGVPVIRVPELAERLAELAARFYGRPGDKLRLIGITGTNGKTSCSHFLARTLTHLGCPTAALGTNGYGFIGRLRSASHTTPDVIGLQRVLAEFVDEGADAVAMEVSSHALDQKRVAGLGFEYALFTNLTRDHLDYHGDMAAYGRAKQRLFDAYPVRHAVINVDDAFGRELARQVRPAGQVITYALQPRDADVQVTACRYGQTGIEASVRTPWGEVALRSPLLGDFNLSNLLAALAVLGQEGYPPEALSTALAAIPAVEGRMERFGGEGMPLVVIDYAHTPDALEKALAGLRQHAQGRLWCLFGCGGDRDRGKRPLMGAVAEAGADAVVVTSDNPRSESPQAIIEQICQGMAKREQLWIEPDRARAIRDLISRASPEDIVLVAGKGHEEYQEIQGTRYPFRDADEVKAALAGRRGND